MTAALDDTFGGRLLATLGGLAASVGVLVLLGAPTAVSGIVLVFVIAAAATAVVVWKRWCWLAVATFLIATPQWWVYLAIDESPNALATLAVLVAFGALTVVAAVACGRRGVGLLVLNAVALGAAAYPLT